MKEMISLIASCVLASSCAAPKDKLARCSADENPLAAVAYYEAEAPLAPVKFRVQENSGNTSDCGPLRPVNPF